jgi:HPt (histidine-containing phosphotransfer) domain-containing protein
MADVEAATEDPRASGATPATYDGQMAPLNGADGLDDALRALWDRTLPRVLARVAVLDEAAAALAGGRLDDHLCDRARTEAHRLAGTLGTMGLPDASPVAKRLERLLEAGPGPNDAAPLQDGARILRGMVERGPV